MKASEVIKRLQELYAEHGDLETYYEDLEYGDEGISGVDYVIDKQGGFIRVR